MTDKVKTYEVPEELKELMIEYVALEECRNKAIESMFKARKAIYYSKRMVRIGIKFWAQVKILHPHSVGEKLTYHYDDQVVKVRNEDS